jgi:hypothetical protein
MARIRGNTPTGGRLKVPLRFSTWLTSSGTTSHMGPGPPPRTPAVQGSWLFDGDAAEKDKKGVVSRPGVGPSRPVAPAKWTVPCLSLVWRSMVRRVGMDVTMAVFMVATRW